MKNLFIVLLVVINVLLAGALIYKTVALPVAKAQPIGLSGNYLMVSGAILGTRSDEVYIIDLEKRKLHALHYEHSTGRITLQGTRDLTQDLASRATGRVRQTGRRIRRRRIR